MQVRREDVHLMGPAEIGRRLGGITRARVYQITQRRTFPEPVAKLQMGYIWLAEDVEDWIAEHRPELAEDPES